MKIVKRSFEINENPKVYGTIYEATPCVGVLILIHDVFEHRFQYEPLIKELNNHQITVITYDLRGHHHSLQDGVIGHFSAEGLIGDLLEVIQLAQKRYPDISLSLMGGKVSGWLINSVLSIADVSKVVIADTIEKPRYLRLKAQILSLLNAKKTSKLGHKWILNDEHLEVSDDPFLNRELTNGSYVAVCDLFQQVARPVHHPVSVLLLVDEQQSQDLQLYYYSCGIYSIEHLGSDDISMQKIIRFIV